MINRSSVCTRRVLKTSAMNIRLAFCICLLNVISPRLGRPRKIFDGMKPWGIFAVLKHCSTMDF